MHVHGLSKYTFDFDYDDENIILYNSLNRATVLINCEQLNGRNFHGDNDEVSELNKLGFFWSETVALKHITSTYNNFLSNRLEVIIELTENCNLNCTYCYQSHWSKSHNISPKTIDSVISYISNCFNTNAYLGLQLYFFGGEPLLQSRKILEIYHKAKSICEEHNANIRVHIDTNGILLTNDFINEFDLLRVAVSLTLQEDHDRKRLLKGKGANYAKIESNIIKCNKIFSSDPKKELIIRYNSDLSNKNYLPKFYSHMNNIGIKYTPKIAYTHEHKNNDYKNGMSFDEFKKWHSTEVVDLSIEFGLNVLQAPSVLKTPCRAYYGHNIKIFADGGIGLCNGDFSRRVGMTIENISSHPDSIIDLVHEKSTSPFNNEQCLDCREIAICGGKHFCRDNPCCHGTVELEPFLRTYIKHALLGKQKYFKGFYQGS